MIGRTLWIGLAVLLLSGAARVTPDVEISFPRDRGSHPNFRTEWWYVTGWLEDGHGGALGFQITFFSTHPELTGANPSAFAPREILIAHAALSDPKRAQLWTDQRIARAGFGIAQASRVDTEVWIDRWRLERRGDRYLATIPGRDFSLQLTLRPTEPPLLQGIHGYSQKAPSPTAASYYYSEPQLAVSGEVSREGRAIRVTGSAWLDHEWSSDYLDSAAIGWDWVGINMNDGGALMAFRIRDRGGGALWGGGSWRRADGSVRVFAPGEIAFSARRRWRSPRTGVDYPVSWSLRAGDVQLALEPLMDDQENDARASAGTIYWEGAIRAFSAGAPVGRGYLELTGYGEPLELGGRAAGPAAGRAIDP